MDGILEHVVDEVRRRLYEVIDCLKHLQILPLLLVEEVELVLILIEFHPIDSLLEFIPLILNHFFSLFDFLLFLLQLFYFLINLLFHHLEQILVLNLKLVHDSPKALLQLINLLIELLPNLML